MNTLTLAQSAKEGKELSSLNYPTLIATINTKLAEAGINEDPANSKAIQI